MTAVTYTPSTKEATGTPRWLKVVGPVIVPVVVLILWELAARQGIINTLYFSSPSAIAAAFVDAVRTGMLYEHLGASVSRVVLGFAVGAVPGIAIGLLLGVSPLAQLTLGPTLNAIYPLPKIALLPLFIMIFGLGETSKWATIAIGVFFPVMINTLAGVKNIERIYVDVGNNYGANRWNYYRTIALPGAIPFVFAGLRIGLGVALLLIVAAEFVGTTTGIGYMIWNSWQIFKIENLFIGLVIIALLGVTGNILLRAAEWALCPWRRGRK